MKKILFILSIIGVVLLQSCVQTTNNNTTSDDATPASKPHDKASEALVEFDNPDAEIATTANYYFVFDCSGSMGHGCAGDQKMKGAKKSLLNFIEKVPTDANIGLLVFGVGEGNGVEEVVPLSPYNDVKDLFINKVKSLKDHGSTPLARATKAGTNKLIEQYKRQLGYGEYRLIIISDGDANDEGQFRKALNYTAKHSFISIYGIGLCMSGDNVLKNYTVMYAEANDYDELEKALEATVSELEEFDISTFDPSIFEN